MIGNNILESQKILFLSEDGSVNLHDQRINGISLSHNLNKTNGIPDCISDFYNENNIFLIESLSGKIIAYDLRINKAISEKIYNNGIPILGMYLHK